MKGSESFDRYHVLPALVLFVIITMLPIVMVLYQGAGPLLNSFADKENLLSFVFSLAFAASCAIVSVLIALPGAHIIARYRIPLKALFRSICLLCLCTPTLELILSYSALESLLLIRVPSPFFNQAVALVMSNAPLAVLLIGSYWAALDDSMEESASTMGFKKTHVFRTVTLPYLRNAIIGTGALIFIRCMAEFTVSSSVLGFLFSLAALAIFSTSFFGKGKNTKTSAVHRTERPSSVGLRILVSLYCLILSCATLTGPLSLLWMALFPNGAFDPSAFLGIFSSLKSIELVAMAGVGIVVLPSTIIALFLASRMAYAAIRRMFPILLILPALAAGRALLNSGFVSLAMYVPTIHPIILSIISETTFLIPIAVIVMLPRYRSLDDALQTQATTLGFSARHGFYSTEAKVLRPAVIAAMLIVLAISISEFSSQMILIMFASAMTTLPTVGALSTCTTTISFILLLAGSILLRKER